MRKDADEPSPSTKPNPLLLAIESARSSIMQAAMDVFSRNGLDTTRVEDLLHAAGVARRTFYKYFRSKEDVLAALYEIATQKLLEAIRGGHNLGGDPLAGIRVGLETYLDFHVDNGPLLRVMVEQGMRADSALAPHRRHLHRELVATLDEAIRARGGKSLDPYVFQALICSLEGLSLHLLESGAKSAEIERAKIVMNGMVDLVLSTEAEARFAATSPADESEKA